MSASTCRWIWPRPATLSELCRRTRITGTCSSRFLSAPRNTKTEVWRRLTPPLSFSRGHASPSTPRHFLQLSGAKYRFLLSRKTLREPARSGRWVRQFGTTNQQQATKPHLYLVLDDHEGAFTIHKLDMDDDLDDGGSVETPLSFPETPLIRLAHPAIPGGTQVAAIGSHIIATCPNTRGRAPVGVTFDTKTAKLTMSNIVLPEGLQMGYDEAIALEDRLYVIKTLTDGGFDPFAFRGGLHSLIASHCLTTDSCHVGRHWNWKPFSNSSQFCWSWTAYPPMLLFDATTITAHAVHPQTGTIFVSAECGHVGRERLPGVYRQPVYSAGTFSYDPRGSGQWESCGDWVLPFKGHAHYDDVLGAWVGLKLISHASMDDAYGYLCVCSVVSSQQNPNWKFGESLLLKHPLWRHEEAKLVHMRERGEYCLVERLLPEGADKMDHWLRRTKYVLRLTTFAVKYDDDGGSRLWFSSLLVSTRHPPIFGVLIFRHFGCSPCSSLFIYPAYFN